MIDSPLLSVPPEVLILIAHVVANTPNRSYSITTKPPNRKGLLNLSVCNKTLRHAYIYARLLNAMNPHEEKKGLSLGFDEFSTRHELRSIYSLSVNLGCMDGWKLCAHLMGRFPDLDQLILYGSPTFRPKVFVTSDLASKFPAFRSSSLVLNRITLTATQS